MKTPKEWMEFFDMIEFEYGKTIKIEDIAAIQKDARAELLDELEKLEMGEHA